tara:strand:- start:34123 stop:34629 length:507 start_codon:yes stop_codon:yes gene_type:complete
LFTEEKGEFMLQDKIKLDSSVTIGPQVGVDEIQNLAQKGFSTVVNLTIKGECDQILSPQDEGEQVESLGMNYVHIPVTLNKLNDNFVDEVCGLLESVPKPLYMHCRIGQRSSILGLAFFGLRKGITAKTVLKRSKEFGIRWRAPYFKEFLTKYIQRTRDIRKEVLASS